MGQSMTVRGVRWLFNSDDISKSSAKYDICILGQQTPALYPVLDSELASSKPIVITKHISQFGLRQLELRAQGQHQLPKGVVSLAVRGPLNGHSLFVSFPQVLRCEGMCGAKVSRCPVTSSSLPSILQNRSILA